MELSQLVRAVSAHKRIAIAGLIAALGLALLAQVRVSPFGDPMFTYRKHTVWSSKITLQLTQNGFPEGRVQEAGTARDTLIGLAPLYARLANTDQVRNRMHRLGPVRGGIKIVPLVDENQSSLPLLEMRSFAFEPSSAQQRVSRQATAFIGYISQQQAANDVGEKNRVLLKVIKGPTEPRVVVPRKITLSVVVFLAMLVATGGLILALENISKRGAGSGARRPETRPPLEAIAPEEPEPVPVPVEQRAPEPAPSQAAGSQLAVAPTPTRPMRTLGQSQQQRDVDGEDGQAAAAPDPSQRSRASGRGQRG
jgi:hypothetical protein